MMRIPSDLRYSREHLWVLVDGEQARVGITDHHQDALGEIVFAKLPQVGDSIGAGQTVAEVESSKSVSDVYAPISGSVVGVNERLADSPGLLNTDPYGSGWLYDVMMSYEETLEQLLTAEQYRELVGD
ncbi:MAG: glycine cleavage system protein GcvH [Actinobacteria bacterium]|nr:glycine cleavage system protein GcvH [Actinomycetota bacterium]NBT26206.1 glycine cleavage system protein GcvH [Actinomycetota bacterium]NBY12361.1 glycine cleavage system protein GcvH [Actinomycetota bacterium]NDC26639.1 glycine cleavage system protein GcvH [Actinomycetota bacterium]NDD86592.1 glycine cleavage system protein GcvH [Actinomycetota bacterium]